MEEIKIIGLAADHAGFKIKEFLKNYLIGKGYKIIDFGTSSDESVDYPDFGHALAKSVDEKKVDFGVSVCGSGNGINMVANKYSKVRSALCWNVEIARLAVKHNKANICALPGRFINNEIAKEIIDVFLTFEFEGGRHQIRIDKIPVK